MEGVLRRVGRVRGRRVRGERGAALVEAALILPLILLIVFGAIEYGFAFKDASSVSSAARSGGRIASSQPKDAGMMQDAATAVATALNGFPISPKPEVWVYQAGANGYPEGASDFSLGCVTKCVQYELTWLPTGGGFFRADRVGGTWDIADQHVCPGTDAATWSRVGIYVKVGHGRIVPGLLPAPTTLTDHAMFRLEPVDSAGCPST